MIKNKKNVDNIFVCLLVVLQLFYVLKKTEFIGSNEFTAEIARIEMIVM